MGPTAKEKFVSYLDKTLQNSPVRQFGADNREARQTAMESKYGADMANNTANNESTISAALKGQTQLIGDRPSIDIDKHPVDEQGKYFEANAVTKSEGSLLEKMKTGFETVNKAFKEKLNKAEINRDVFKIKDLVAVGENGAKKEFNKANYFKKSEIEKFISLDPEKHQKVDTTTPPPTIENPVNENADKLLEGLYGKDFKDKLNQLLSERLNLTGKSAGDPSFDLIENLKAVANHNAALTSSVDSDSVKAMLINAVKTSIISNPKDIQNILSQLASSDIQISAIPDLQKNIENGILKLTIDEYIKTQSVFFIPVAGGTSEQEAKDNRKALADKLRGGPAGTVTLKSNGTTVALTTGTISNVTTLPGFTSITTSKIGPKTTTDLQNLNNFKTDLYKGLRASVTGDMSLALKNVSRVMVDGDPESLFTILVKDGLIPATDGSKSVIERFTLFAQIENKLAQEIAAPGINPTLKAKLEKVQESLVAYSTPEGIAIGIEKDMLSKVVDGLTGTGGVAGLNKGDLLLAINNALKVSPTSKSIFERLSILVADINDKTKKDELNNLLRSVANVEIIREIAIQQAGPSDPNLTKQYMLVLLNKFVFTDGNNDVKAQSLLDLLYAKPNADKVIVLDIAGDANMKAYLEKLLGSTATLQAKLEINGQASTGFMYARAHELLGIIRKGVEAGEWKEVATKSDAEIKKYLAENFGIKEDAEQMTDILTRFKEITGTGATGVLALSTVIDKAKGGDSTVYGSNYTNLTRMFRHYIIHGGELDAILKDFEKQSLTQFVNAVQKQADGKLGSAEGDVLTDKNKVLSVEEQRASIFQNYEDLSGAKGFRGFLKRMVAAVPRVVKAAGFMAIASLSAAFPIAAGPIALGLAAVRIFSVYKTVTAGIPMIKDMWKRGDSKMAWAVATGVGVNVLVNTLVPTPWGVGLSLIGEVVGADLFAMKGMKQEAKTVVEAHNNYDTAFATYFGTLSNPTDKATIERIAKSINATVALDATNNVDLGATLNDIVAKRNAARQAGNMTILREYSQLVESLIPNSVNEIRNANKRAQGIHEDTQRTLMAYTLASSATKLGYGIGRGMVAGWNDGDGGILGGALGAVGIADYRTLLDFNGGNESSDTGSESITLSQSEISSLQTNLENQFDEFTASHGLDTSSENVLGLAQTGDGTTYALIDLDGDPNTVETFIPLDQNGNLDFSGITASAETGGGAITSTEGLEGYFATAESGDSQWTLVEDTLRQAYPNASDQQIWNATANIINEATPGGVYEQVYDNRVGGGGGAVRIGDTLSLRDISEMAPNQFERLENNVGRTGTPSTITNEDVTSEGLVFPSNEAPANITGAILFDSPEGVIGGGNLAFLSQFGTSDDGVGGSTTTNTQTSDDTSDTNTQTGINWRELLLGRPTDSQPQTGGGNVSETTNPTYDTFTIKDPGIFGDNAQIDESKVEGIIVHSGFDGMPDTVIDPRLVDIVEVTKNGVEYIDQSGNKVFVENGSGDIAFKFVGVEQPVNFSQGTDNILDAVNNLAQGVAQVGQEVANQTGEFASTVAQASQAAEDLKTSVDRTVTGVQEIFEDIKAVGYEKGAYFDGDYNGEVDFPITNSGLKPDGTGQEYTATIAGPSTTAGDPAYIEFMSIDKVDGSKFTISLDQVIKVGSDYITYIDPQTNEAVTVNGTNLVGVGTSYTVDPNTQQYVKHDPYQFTFSPTGVTTATPVENPWWDINEIVIDNVPKP